ncbi:CGNR zinc finger domain-containing protein [Nocardia sp. CDC159]|uniref:CGNR zinc finger domain-containing protein n=1 Tax=Nocardia pulmonis TaxID=2951408 RepID=A0A9X2ECU4_9NOCA|nr:MULTISPECIES: CGNR zinc finger domain-containing protein [Nocardia]MCM6778114.1 CGNR zinc finger domain-containing protein [Nocardia pulmonis]MCM6791003.1 CGNR zinc finger domain-containing protein [Nocardia sp. CDC159]
MHFNPYGGAAAELAALLVNAEPDADLIRLLDDFGYRPITTLDAEQESRLREWVRRLDEIFTAPTVEALNTLLSETTSRPYISTHDNRPPHLHFAWEGDPMDERVRAYTAAGLATLFCEAPTRIGRCARPGCRLVFIDTSRNGRRRFCSTRCSTRVHVAEHRRRAG